MASNNIVEALQAKGLTLGCAESFTGGGFANAITNISGSSNVFKGGFVTYTNEIKHSILNVSEATLNEKGAISPECVKEMLINTQRLLGVDIAVAFSGNAGPTVSEDKEVGLVYIGFLYHNDVIIDKLVIKAERTEVKAISIDYAINKILELIK